MVWHQLFMEIQYLPLFSAIFHSHLPISSTRTVHAPKISSSSLLDASSPVNMGLTSQTKCSISSINDGDVKNGIVDQPVPCTCFCSMIMISFLVLFITKKKHVALHATITATTLQVVDVDTSAKVVSFWCHLVVFDHACHVSKQ